MHRQLHKILVSNSATRSFQRRLTRWVKSLTGCPDAYGDIAKVVRTGKPSAILDIGAHVGDTVARLMEDNAIPIHGFEPTAETFQRLSARFSSTPQVTLHQLALCDRTGDVQFQCNANEQTNSLLDNDTGNTSAFPDMTKNVSTQVVRAMTMDDWVDDTGLAGPLVIKADIQGAEGLLIAGGIKTLRTRVIAFFSEAQIAPMYEDQTDFCELHRLLVDMGFALQNIYPCMHDENGCALQTDALWVNPQLLNAG